ncbi:MAG: hypothetical protein V1888_01745 [archaeon]
MTQYIEVSITFDAKHTEYTKKIKTLLPTRANKNGHIYGASETSTNYEFNPKLSSEEANDLIKKLDNFDIKNIFFSNRKTQYSLIHSLS